jgi:tetratricopeptide (TPR) repeat protein
MNLKAMLIRFYMSRNEMDEAEGFLREISDPTDTDPDAYLSLVRFLLEQRGVGAALAELNSAIEANPDSVLLRNLRAGIDFEQGRREEAMSDLETLLAQAGEEADQGQLLQVKVTLARMFMSTGNEVGARRLVGETLEQDASQVDALKMQAAWQIEADETDEAVSTLRAALDQNPQDAQAMTLMAQAYTRSGSHELARDFLSLAVEASGNAPAEAIRYASVLTSEGRYQAAESTLLSARRVDPSNVGVLQELGRVYLATKDAARIAQVIDTLRRLETPEALRAADALQVQNLSSKDGASGAISFLEDLAENDNNLNAKIAIVRARLVSGDTTSAYEYAKAILAEDPENPILQYTWYATLAATGDVDGALKGYRKILAENPTGSRIWLEVARLTTAQGKLEEARAAIEEGLKNTPLSGPLLWAKASYLERDGAYEEAIAIYETLYEQDSNHLVVANNLASMLSTYRDDEESLTRAFNVSRRLRGTEIPQLRDTYGWILHLRGDQEEALLYMEPAAAAMPRQALVQYRLGAIYEAMNKPEEALIQFKKAVQLAGEIDTRPEIERARAVILEAGN